MSMTLKATPTAHTTPYLNSYFNDSTNMPFSSAYRDETYTGSITSAGSCAVIESNDELWECDIIYHGFDVSSMPKAILDKVTFNFQISAWAADTQWVKTSTGEQFVTESYFALICGDTEIFRGDFLSGEFSILEYYKKTFSIDITNLVTSDSIKDFKLRLYIKKKLRYDTPAFKFMGASLNIEYTPLHEVRIPTSNFIAPFKNEPIEYSTSDSYAWNITKAYSLPDEDNYSAELIFPNGKVGDGYFCGFDISSIPEHSPIFEAYFKIRVATGSRNSNRYYKAYTSDAELSSVSIPNVDDTYIIPIPKPKRELLQDIRLVLEAKGYQSNSFDNVYGVELYVVYGDPIYNWVPSYASNFIQDRELNLYSIFYNAANCYDEPSTTNYAEFRHGYTTEYRTSAWSLINFHSDNLNSDDKIIGLSLRASFSTNYIQYNPRVWFEVYLDNTLLKKTDTYYMQEVDFIYSVQADCGNVNIKYSDINRLQVKLFYQDTSQHASRINKLYGLSLDLLASNNNERPEWYPIIDIIVKNNNYTKDITAAKPSNDVVVNTAPETQGYIGNLYNDDLDDYAEFTYTPVPDENGVMPEDKPEFETIDLGVIRIDSPKLSSLGIPDNAVITNIELTKESLKHCASSNVSAELSLYINDNRYSSRGFSTSANFVKTTYNTGVISIPKADIRNDVAYFLLKWNSLNTPFTFQVKYLLWDITYELGGLKYSVQFADGEIQQITVGNTKASSLYKGKEKLF